MKRIRPLVLCGATFPFAISATGARALDGTANLIDAKNNNIGSVELTETPSGITKIAISATGLPTG